MRTYPKIETLFARDDDFRVTRELRDPAVALISRWVVTEKIDGTNIRIGMGREDDHLTFAGRSDRAQLPGPLVQRLREREPDIIPVLRNAMDTFDVGRITLFGEGYGPKIQGGGDYRDDQDFILFDVLVDEKFWLPDSAVSDYASALEVLRVPVLAKESTLNDIISRVAFGFSSVIAERSRPAEGIVARPEVPLYKANGRRLIIKLKTKDFA